MTKEFVFIAFLIFLLAVILTQHGRYKTLEKLKGVTEK